MIFKFHWNYLEEKKNTHWKWNWRKKYRREVRNNTSERSGEQIMKINYVDSTIVEIKTVFGISFMFFDSLLCLPTHFKSYLNKLKFYFFFKFLFLFLVCIFITLMHVVSRFNIEKCSRCNCHKCKTNHKYFFVYDFYLPPSHFNYYYFCWCLVYLRKSYKQNCRLRTIKK